MLLNILKSKLHRVTVTQANLDYEGSCGIDPDLMEAAQILPFEQLHIYNLKNGERFTTYAILAEQGSGAIQINGAAAHKAQAGDLLIICTYASLSDEETQKFQPQLVYVDSENRITHKSHLLSAKTAP